MSFLTPFLVGNSHRYEHWNLRDSSLNCQFIRDFQILLHTPSITSQRTRLHRHILLGFFEHAPYLSCRSLLSVTGDSPPYSTLLNHPHTSPSVLTMMIAFCLTGHRSPMSDFGSRATAPDHSPTPGISHITKVSVGLCGRSELI